MDNKKGLIVIIILLSLFCIMNPLIRAEEEPKANNQTNNENLVTLTVREAKIRDVLVMLTEQCEINMVPDETVEGEVTVNLKDVKLRQALETLTMAYGYQFQKVNPNTYLVSKKKFDSSSQIKVENNKLTLHVAGVSLRSVLKKIAQEAEINIVMDDSVSGRVSVDLSDVPLEEGLVTFLGVNGYSISKKNNIYKVYKVGERDRRNNLNISALDDKISIDVKQANVAEVLRTISRLTGQDMVLFEGVRGRVDLKLDKVSIEEAIEITLSGTRYTYRKINEIYYIGSKRPDSPGSALFTTNELIFLDYLNAEKFPKFLPSSFPASNVKVIKEQNAILVTGTQEQIKELKKYVKKVDRKIPQIVIEALIIELTYSKNRDPMSELGVDYGDEEETTLFKSTAGKLTYESVLELPEDFYVKLQSLVSNTETKIKARPNVTTLNGQEANINIETVQYYQTVSTDDDGNKETKYESVNAGINLSVTPWVSESGKINLKLNPDISNPRPDPDRSGPPNINRREVSTTVRVENGESIVLGGLIQNQNDNSQEKVPILGDIPLIGSLFRDKSKAINKTELVIYITPRILGDESKEEVRKSKERMLEKVEEDIEEKN